MDAGLDLFCVVSGLKFQLIRLSYVERWFCLTVRKNFLKGKASQSKQAGFKVYKTS